MFFFFLSVNLSDLIPFIFAFVFFFFYLTLNKTFVSSIPSSSGKTFTVKTSKGKGVLGSSLDEIVYYLKTRMYSKKEKKNFQFFL